MLQGQDPLPIRSAATMVAERDPNPEHRTLTDEIAGTTPCDELLFAVLADEHVG